MFCKPSKCWNIETTVCGAHGAVARFNPGVRGAAFLIPRSRHHGIGFRPTELGHPVEDVTPDRDLSPLPLVVHCLQAASEHGLVSEEPVLHARLLSVARLLLPRSSPNLANPLKSRFTLRPWTSPTPQSDEGDHNHDVLCTGRAGPIVDRPVVVGLVRRETPDGNFDRVEKIRESYRLFAVSSAATMNPSAATSMGSFRLPRCFFNAVCLCAFHSPQPKVLNSVESTS